MYSICLPTSMLHRWSLWSQSQRGTSYHAISAIPSSILIQRALLIYQNITICFCASFRLYISVNLLCILCYTIPYRSFRTAHRSKKTSRLQRPPSWIGSRTPRASRQAGTSSSTLRRPTMKFSQSTRWKLPVSRSLLIPTEEALKKCLSQTWSLHPCAATYLRKYSLAKKNMSLLRSSTRAIQPRTPLQRSSIPRLKASQDDKAGCCLLPLAQKAKICWGRELWRLHHCLKK